MAQGFPVPFGKYLLTDLIAVGGMAEIYRAKIFGVNGFEKQMVVKRILPKYAQNPSFVQMFVDEAKVLVSLTHGNIVPVYELGEVGGNYYIAMEYAEGITTLDLLRECYVKGKPLGVANALYIAAEVCKGLGYAHTRSGPDGQSLGIVHRDLNPRNIVVSPAGEVKILDFGIARSSVKKHQTGSGIIKGTPGYMAPEQVMGYSVDARADQYGLAIILHELITVRRLISVKDAAEHRAKLAEGPLQAPSHYRADIPASVDQVVMRALSYKPEERYANCLDFEDALRAEIGLLGAAVTSRSLSTTIQTIKNSPAVDNASGGAINTKPVQSQRSQTQPPASQPASALPPAGAEPAAQAGNVAAPVLVPMAASPLGATPNSGAGPRVEEDFTEVLKLPPKPAAPLPSPALPVTGMSAARPATQVLALNADLGWANKIGDDAEMLVLAKSMGLKSKTPQRVTLGLLLGTAAVVGLWILANPEEFRQMRGRATEGRRAVTGALIAKSRPSGATVLIDGEEMGKTNLRLESVVLDTPRKLTIKLLDGREMTRTLEAKDFPPPERKLEVMFDPSVDGGPGDGDGGAPKDAVSADPKEDTKPHKGKRKKRG